MASDVDYADEHEGGQLRLGVAGEQRPLLPLSDADIPVGELETDDLRAVVRSARGELHWSERHKDAWQELTSREEEA